MKNTLLYLSLITLLTLTAACQQRQAAWVEEKELPTFYIYGEPAPIGYLDNEDTITEKYGFRLLRVAGCIVDSKLLDSVKMNNTAAYKFMAERYGTGWIQNFETETGFKLSIPDIID